MICELLRSNVIPLAVSSNFNAAFSVKLAIAIAAYGKGDNLEERVRVLAMIQTGVHLEIIFVELL